jgi:hypothetical protein
MSQADLELAQRLIDGGRDALHEIRRAEWSALEARRWAARLDDNHPTPSMLRPFARAEHRRCRELALEQTAAAPESITFELIPIWTGDNFDAEEPAPCWYVTHALRIDGELAGPLERSPVFDDAELVFDHRLSIRALRWRVGYVVKTRSYAPSMKLHHRGKHLGVIVGELLTVQTAARNEGQPCARPTRDVPPFCQWIEPRVDGLDDALVAELRSLSTTVDDEGNIIE